MRAVGLVRGEIILHCGLLFHADLWSTKLLDRMILHIYDRIHKSSVS